MTIAMAEPIDSLSAKGVTVAALARAHTRPSAELEADMRDDERVRFHADLAREHRAAASCATDAKLKHYHRTMADYHAAKATDAACVSTVAGISSLPAVPKPR